MGRVTLIRHEILDVKKDILNNNVFAILILQLLKRMSAGCDQNMSLYSGAKVIRLVKMAF